MRGGEREYGKVCGWNWNWNWEMGNFIRGMFHWACGGVTGSSAFFLLCIAMEFFIDQESKMDKDNAKVEI